MTEMLTKDESQIVRAHVVRHFTRDTLHVVGLNLFPVIFVGLTGIATIWYYLGWFALGSFCVASFGCSISRISIRGLAFTDRLPQDIVTPKRGTLLIGIQAGITALTRWCVV